MKRYKTFISSPEDFGEFIITSDSLKVQGTRVMLQDRSISKSDWWTSDHKLAKVFNNKKLANQVLSKLKLNNPKVETYQRNHSSILL